MGRGGEPLSSGGSGAAQPRDERTGHRIRLSRRCGNVGVATGPLFAAVLLAFVDWRTVAALLLVPVLLAAVVGARLEFDETAGTSARGADDATAGEGPSGLAAFLTGSRRLFTVGFGLVFAIGILYGVAYRAAFTFLPDILAALPLLDPITFVGRSFDPSQYVYSGLLLVGGVGQYVGGKLVDARGSRPSSWAATPLWPPSRSRSCRRRMRGWPRCWSSRASSDSSPS